jgi:hypothetical protein
MDLLPGPGKAPAVEFAEASQHGLSVVSFPASFRMTLAEMDNVRHNFFNTVRIICRRLFGDPEWRLHGEGI